MRTQMPIGCTFEKIFFEGVFENAKQRGLSELANEGCG